LTDATVAGVGAVVGLAPGANMTGVLMTVKTLMLLSSQCLGTR
jgi:hypothetical protein